MKRAAGFVILICVILVAAIASHFTGRRTDAAPGQNTPASSSGAPMITLHGLVGGEKLEFLNDPDVNRILKDRYGLMLSYDRRGSIEMVKDSKSGQQDFLWPSSEVALQMYKELGHPMRANEIIFNSPIVLYSWDSVTNALMKAKLVSKVAGTYYIVNMGGLVRKINSGATWNQIGLDQLYGQMTIYSTDPLVSNSGNMFAGLLANVLSGGKVATEASVSAALPTVKKFFDSQGFMEQSSSVIFQQYLNRGVGDKPLVIGYESQLIEYTVSSPNQVTARKDAVRTLYPRPTVWSSHPLIAISENGAKLIPALQDRDIQKIAWEKHGFRSALQSVDASAVRLAGVPATIDNVMPMPSPHVMETIMAAIEKK